MKPATANDARPSVTLGDVSKDKVVRLRATDEERARWSAAAKKADLTMSEWLRFLANGASYTAIDAAIDHHRRVDLAPVDRANSTEETKMRHRYVVLRGVAGRGVLAVYTVMPDGHVTRLPQIPKGIR